MVGVLGGLAAGSAITIVIQAIDRTANVFGKVNKGMLAMGVGLTAVGVASATAVGGFVKLAGEFEQTTIAFTTMLGSGGKAQKLLKDLADFAARTPFTIPDVEKNAKLLLAMGTEVDNMIPTLKALGDVSAGLSVPMDRLALNFGQVRVQGRLTGRELRDFSVAGVPLIAELAKNLNLSEAAVKDMVSAGKIGFDDVERAFQTMTGEGGKFFDLMDAQSKTFFGQISNIQDSFVKLGRVMGEDFLPIAKFVAGTIQNITAAMEEHPKIAKFVAVLLSVVAAVFLVLGPILLLIASLPILTAGFAIAAGALAPWIVGIIAVVAAITALIIIMANWRQILVDLLKMLEFGAAVWTILWTAWLNVVKMIWNAIVDVVQFGANKIIDMVNWLIRQVLRIPGAEDLFPGLREIKQLNFSNAKAEIVDLGAKWTQLMAGANARVKALENALKVEKEITEESEKQEKVANNLTREQQILIDKGFKVTRNTGDIFNPKNFRESEFQDRNAFEVARAGGGVTINIENVNGLDPTEVAEALQDVLDSKILT